MSRASGMIYLVKVAMNDGVQEAEKSDPRYVDKGKIANYVVL